MISGPYICTALINSMLGNPPPAFHLGRLFCIKLCTSAEFSFPLFWLILTWHTGGDIRLWPYCRGASRSVPFSRVSVLLISCGILLCWHSSVRSSRLCVINKFSIKKAITDVGSIHYDTRKRNKRSFARATPQRAGVSRSAAALWLCTRKAKTLTYELWPAKPTKENEI